MNKPNINIKDVLKKLSFLKSNLPLLASIIIAVVALLLFIPTRLLSGKLRQTVQANSVQPGQSISRLIGQVDEAARAQALEPYIAEYARDANQIEILMRQTTERELLSYEIFPDTNEGSTLIFERFAQNYGAGIDAMLKSVRAGVPPTDLEVEAALKNAPKSPYGMMYGAGDAAGYGGPVMGMPTSTTGRPARKFSTLAMTDMQLLVVNPICIEKAKSAGVYASAADLPGYAYWDQWRFTTRDDAYRDCWYWQLGYWIIEDVIASIHQANAGAESLVDAPVKRLTNLSFTLMKASRSMKMKRGRRPGAQVRKEGDNPIYIKEAKDGMTNPCTGRLSDDSRDIVHFAVSVVIRANDVMTFMEQLCRAKEHRFAGWKGDQPVQTYKHNPITILESATEPVEALSLEHDFYHYGSNPVVKLDLICEYLFNKAAYENVKPQQVKDDQLGTEEGGTGW